MSCQTMGDVSSCRLRGIGSWNCSTCRLARPGWGERIRIDEHLPAVPESVAFARSRVREFSRAAGANDRLVGHIALVVTEATSNAVLHAYRGAPDQGLSITAILDDGVLVVEVRDFGVGPAPHPEAASLGIGLVVMERLADTLTVERAHPGTRVTLRFHLDGGVE
jgi:anti-sigma regulatory factor (Ser/Thr protein kinase)